MTTQPNEGPVIEAVTLRGKSFTPQEIKTILECVEKYYDKGRTFISVMICNDLNWKQPNGWLKDRACRDVLMQLEKRGLFTLPPRICTPINHKRKLTDREIVLSEYDLESPITQIKGGVNLVFAKGNDYEIAWNCIVDKYHYLGHRIAVGRCIKYLVKHEEGILGAICFSSSSWKLSSRDGILNLLEIDDPSNTVINNSRFLILPRVQVRNFASHVLSISTQQIVTDWHDYYALQPLIAETFVDSKKYHGTCYKAANWVAVGQTKGYAKQGGSHHNSQEPKEILLYGLTRQLRRKLHIITTQQVSKRSR